MIHYNTFIFQDLLSITFFKIFSKHDGKNLLLYKLGEAQNYIVFG